ncbi:MAG TPA: hypothetical protein VEX15_12250 [Nocardioidaceae bacterium]|nr:hypothetical protein [Nocardioidaceae bacterium]
MTKTTPSALSRLPEGWRVLRTWGPASFVTHALLERPDGTQVEWNSRRHRKALGLRGSEARRQRRQERWGGRPSAMSWWMGALFGLGAICFAVGSVPIYFDNIDPGFLAGTFFVGSILFTSAGYLQFHETVHAPDSVLPGSPAQHGLRALIGWRPRRIDWWAALIQLVGTVMFNVSTFAATRSDLSLDQSRHLIWAPDIGGSICFLVASWLAYAEVNRGILPRSDRSTGWRIAVLNLGGSVAFGAAAIGARYVGSAGDPANVSLVNLGTFVGAVGFLVGAALLPVESAKDASPSGGRVASPG